jgi:osmoprotectant transport system ATP-binding protein
VVDGDARPVGWVDPGQPGRTLPLGATFDVEAGTLRNALDAVLTSPVSLAVGVVPGSGRYAGVATTETILAGVHRARVRQTETVTVRKDATPDAEPEDGHATVELGEESGQDVAAEALRPEDAPAAGADRTQQESDLPTEESRAVRDDGTDVRR